MSFLLTVKDLSRLLESLNDTGFRTLGPVVRDGVVTYGRISSAEDLPHGFRDEQAPGRYRLVEAAAGYFDALPGQASWKQVLFPSVEPLWEAETVDGALRFTERMPTDTKLALIGARACEMAAIAVQDRVFLQGDAKEPRYGRRRANIFIVAVECGRAAPTCFCTSLGTGPRINPGSQADIVLTELPDVGFVARQESERGKALLDSLGCRAATVPEMAAAVDRVAAAANSMQRRLDQPAFRATAPHAADTRAWASLEERCLACGNCTAVCPTCFCTSAVDSASLDGVSATRDRVWASCFTNDYSYMAGHTVRTSVGARYRQWITHKLSTWVDQFGTLGCVGCGRCITWCPVGIDLVAEATRVTREASNA